MPHDAVRLFRDATGLRGFPPVRAAWALRGEQAVVPITGRNAKRVLFGTLNPRTGPRLGLRRRRQRHEDFQAFVRYLRQHYPGRQIWLLLDKAPGHDAARSHELAARLKIVLVWLPKQCSERNAVDHLGRALKRLMAANRQFRTIDDEADHAEHWFLGLSAREALCKGGVLSHNFWLKDFV
jgi:DDE superfamily endonuclease